MRLPRFTILQLFLVTALCALVAGWLTQAWQAGKHARRDSVEISPDGKRLATTYWTGGLDVWDISGEVPRQIGLLGGTPGYLHQARFLDDGTLVLQRLGGQGSELVLYDPQTRRETTLVRSSTPWQTWGVSLDGKVAASCDAPFTAAAVTIDVWDLTTGQRLSQHKLPKAQYVAQLELNANGTLVAASDQMQSQVHLLDVATGQVRDIKGGIFFASGGLAADGKSLAVIEWPIGAAAATPAPVVKVYDLTDPTATPRSPVALDIFPTNLQVSRDGSRLLLSSFAGTEVWDVPQSKRLWKSDHAFSPLWMDFSLLMEQGTMSADGSRVMRSAGRDGILVLDGSTGRRLHTIGGINRLAYTLAYTLGFVAWGVGWGVLSRRQRLKEIAAGIVHAPDPGRATRTRIMRIWISVAVLVLIVIVVGPPLFGGGSWRGFASGIGWTLGLIVLVVAAAIAMRLVWARLFPVGYAVRQATLLTREKGRRVDYGIVQGWFLGNSTIEADFPQHIEEVRWQTSELLGCQIVLRYPLLVLGVEHQDQFDRLHAKHVPHGAITVRRWWVDEARVCQETCRRFATAAYSGLRYATALALLRRYWRMQLPQWLANALITWSGREEQRYAEDIRQSHRLLWGTSGGRLRELWDQALSISLTDWTALLFAKDSAEPLQRGLEMSALTASIGAFFLSPEAGRRREQFLAFVRGLGPKDDIDAAFVKAFGKRPMEFFDAWLEWLESQPLVPLASPRAEVAGYVRGYLLLAIAGERLPIEERRRCVVALGAAGSVVPAEPLIELLEEENGPLRPEALWALRALSGQSGSENTAQWREWLAAARPPVLATAVARAVLPEDSSRSEVVAAELADQSSPAAGWPSSSLQELFDRPPWQLTAARWLWGILGVWGIFYSVVYSFYMPLFSPLPIFGCTLLVGLATLTRAAGRHWWGLAWLPPWQLMAFGACDPFTGLSGAITARLIRSATVQDYLRAVGGN